MLLRSPSKKQDTCRIIKKHIEVYLGLIKNPFAHLAF